VLIISLFMLKIRFSRAGRKHVPHYRIVVTEHTKPVKCGEVDILGWYDAQSKKYDINMDKVRTRVGQGAQLSPSVAKLLKANSLSI
jgi:small subunit ribosomal protein S16